MRTMAAGRGGPSLEGLRELWAFREVFVAFVTRRIKTRYKQALLGVAWVVLQPILSALVFAFFLGRLARLPSEGSPYFLFILSALALWSYFSHTLGASVESLVGEAGVMRKVYFPREIPPLSVVAASLVDLVVFLGVVLLILSLTGRGPNHYWLLLPLPILIVVLLVAGLGLLLSGVNVYYRDVSHGMPFLIQLGFFLSPIIYSATLIPIHERRIYEVLNPMAGCIQAFRAILLKGQLPDLGVLGLALAWTIVIGLFCFTGFKMIERHFADSV
jgi:lipopolysaccharide transport system permease protein